MTPIEIAKRAVVILAVVVGFVGILVLGGLAYVMLRYPAVGPPPEISVEINDEKIERGRYLANHVVVCVHCHSPQRLDRFANPSVPEEAYHGGTLAGEGFPGALYPENLTPVGMGDWSDGEIARATIEGVGKDGSALFPVMPYGDYRHLSEEDLASIIAYLRSLPAAGEKRPEGYLNFPLNLIVRTIPESATPAAEPDREDAVAYGRYLAEVAGCRSCHSPDATPRNAFTGGGEFPLENGIVIRSVNLTPDPETGLGHWTEEQFVVRFKMYAAPEAREMTNEEVGYRTVMPWIEYSGMSEEDLKAIYAYLQTLEPVKAANE